MTDFLFETFIFIIKQHHNYHNYPLIYLLIESPNQTHIQTQSRYLFDAAKQDRKERKEGGCTEKKSFLVSCCMVDFAIQLFFNQSINHSLPFPCHLTTATTTTTTTNSNSNSKTKTSRRRKKKKKKKKTQKKKRRRRKEIQNSLPLPLRDIFSRQHTHTMFQSTFPKRDKVSAH